VFRFRCQRIVSRVTLRSENSIRVLVVEDNPGDAVLIQHMIAQFVDTDAESRVAANIEDAEELLRREMFSLILCDLDLPDSAGLETVDRILSNAQALPVVVLTGGDPRSTAIDAIRRGAQDFLEKGKVTSETLERIVAHSLERQSLNCALQDSLAELEAANARFVNLVSDLTDPVVVIDLDGIVLFTNPAAERLFHANLSLAVGEPCGLPTEAGLPVEISLTDRDGLDRTAELRVVDTQWDGRPAKLASLRDITERKRTERAMRVAQQAAETANNMKSRFLANMSHELRTPLNSIIGFSEVMKDEAFGEVGNPQYLDYAGDIHRSGHHLLSLINDLLDLSKAESGHYKLPESEFDLVETLAESLRLVTPQADEKRLQIDTSWEFDMCRFRGGEREIIQIAVNLLSNAIKFTPEGGSIKLRLRSGSLGSIMVEVEDSGIGIKAEDLPKLFDAYSQVGDPYQRDKVRGTGLGLALTKRLVELHGGFIRLHSQPARGTTVRVTLPRTRIIDNITDLPKVVRA